MELIDTHIHLDAPEFGDETDALIRSAAELGVKKMLVPNVDSRGAAAVTDVCARYPGLCYPMMGLHPTSVQHDWEEELAQTERLFSLHRFAAVGEIGIDLYWDKTHIAAQEKVFVRQMEIARDLKLPAVIHSRKSLEEIINLIRKHGLGDIPAVFHCFPGSAEQAKRLTSEGYYLGIGGVVTFKNAGMAEVVRQSPPECILLETDAPWLAPVPHRGKRNEPAYLLLVAQKIAEIRGIGVDEVAEITSANARRLFPAIT
jgi:TatD DNase family protein